ncbi:MAG: hypothetical protein JNJ61_25665 [Anaerolineae bacterium]|nr:hypothetical protein [Anaerolineae bacterium]
MTVLYRRYVDGVEETEACESLIDALIIATAEREFSGNEDAGGNRFPLIEDPRIIEVYKNGERVLATSDDIARIDDDKPDFRGKGDAFYTGWYRKHALALILKSIEDEAS